MKVEMISHTPDPEALVCRAARNDYRSEGIIGYSLEELLEDSTVDESVRESAAAYLEEHDDPEYDLDTEVRKRSLIKHLMDHGHWGPFEHVQATIVMEGVTRVLMGQVTRQRHFTFDIMSMRYVKIDDIDRNDQESIETRFQVPECAKEGEVVSRDGVTEITGDAVKEYLAAYCDAMDRYENLMEMGVHQEEARKVLPMGTKVNITMSGNARSWMHILNVRTKANVQGETRRCAENIFDECKEWMPFTFNHYDDNVLPLKLNP